MIPMVSTVAEFLAARELFDKEIAFVKRCGREPPRDIKLGAMVEVPSLLWEIEELAEVADFLSVGSNDLMQYIFAADRVNKRVAGRFDELSPSFLRALKSIADAGALHRKPVTLCGEMGGRPLERDDADRARLPQFLDGGDGDRPGQGDGGVARRRRRRARAPGVARRPGSPRLAARAAAGVRRAPRRPPLALPPHPALPSFDEP